MFVHFLILAFLTQIYCSSICERDTCVCWYKNEKNQDFVGENVQCSYSDTDILRNNYSLPDIVFSLDLSSNNISVVQSSSLLKSNTLLELLLNNNAIAEVKADSFQLPALRRLDLSNNFLEVIDKETFRGLKNLDYLNLANNRFTTFTKLTFHHLSNLNEVILDNNNLGPTLESSNLFDRSGFGLTDKIKSVSISGINLKTVPNNFFVDAYDLRKLIISNNKISEVFELPFTLEYLDISGNPIREISGEDFIDMIALKVLKLNNLQITEVPAFAFIDLHSLKTLELERNSNLSVFSKLAFGREVLADPDNFELETLSLKGSKLSELDEELSAPFGQLVTLDLQGNPWKCDCKIRWVKDLQIPEHLYDHIRCATPPPLFNARIFELNSKYFSCEKHHIGLIISAVSFCAMVTLIAMWVFLCLPNRKNRCNFIKNMYNPSTAYSVLPMATTFSIASNRQ